MTNHKTGWLRFFVWGVAGACFALAISAVGVFTVPLAALLAVGLRKAPGSDRELLGLLEGAGAIIAVVGALNLDYRSCWSRAVHLSVGQRSFSCGGVDGTPWLIVGIAAMLLALLTYLWLNARPSNPPPEGISSSLPG
jgi:hypothetical protein